MEFAPTSNGGFFYAPPRFMVFAGEAYYPRGGWGDFVGMANSEDEARELYRTERDNMPDWAQMVSVVGHEVIHLDIDYNVERELHKAQGK
jgi:hypothetical protein